MAIRAGVIGLGQMGHGIAQNLIAHGLLAAAYDPSVEIEAPRLSGQKMVDACDVLLFAVPATTQIAESLAHCTGDNTIIVDLTTSAPAESTALARELAERSFHYIDAAMTGGAAGADAGTLTLMMGGDAAHITTCEPVLSAIAAQTFHLGPTGSGHAMKLVHNLILHSAFMATCEGLRLAERAGLDPARAVDVLNAGNARSFVTEVRFPRDILSGTLNARSTIANLEKDLGLAVNFAKGLNGPAPYSALTLSLLNAARDTGKADVDFANLFNMFEDLAHQVKAKV